MSIGLASGIVLSIATASPLFAQSISDSELGFTLNLPAGFRPAPELKKANPDYAHVFTLTESGGDITFILVIQRMRGTIGQRLLPDRAPSATSGARHYPMKWQGWEVSAVEMREPREDVQLITHKVMIPLRREAILLKLMGSAELEDRLRSFFPILVSGLAGETNWSGPVFHPTIIPMVAGAVLFTGLVYLYARWKRHRRGRHPML